MKSLLALFIICILVSCYKYEADPTREATYNRLMVNMDLSCLDFDSDVYLRCNIDNTQLCYFDSVEKRKFDFGYYTLFTTAGPSASTTVEGSEVYRRTILSFKHPKFIEGEDYLEISLPKMDSELDQITYLRKFFNVDEYNILDVSNQDNDVRILLKMLDRITDTGGLAYNISSEYGDQQDSYLKVKSIEIKEDKETVSFDFELEFKCNLYHFYQFGREGLWSELTDGVLKAKITLNK